MENKRTAWVIVFTVLYFLLAIYYSFIFLMDFKAVITGDLSNTVTITDDQRFNYLFVLVCNLIALVKTVLYIISAILLVKLRKWGYRIAFLCLCVPIIPEFELPVLIFNIIYFIRPKVRQQFK